MSDISSPKIVPLSPIEQQFFKALNTPQLSKKIKFNTQKKTSGSTLKLNNNIKSNGTLSKKKKVSSTNKEPSFHVSERENKDNVIFSNLKIPRLSNSNISNFILQSIRNSQNDQKSKDSESKRVFWEKTTVEKVWSKLKEVKKKVKAKKDQDYSIILKAISNDEDFFVLETMCNDSFKEFYRNKDNLFPQDVFLETIIEQRKFKLLNQILSDPAYVFDKEYIFTFFYNIFIDGNDIGNSSNNINHNKKINNLLELKEITSKAVSMSSRLLSYKKRSNKSVQLKHQGDNTVQKEVIHNLILMGLYDKDNETKVKIIGWFIAAFSYIDTFDLLLKQNRYVFDNELIQFNNFNTNADVITYGKDNCQFQKTIEYCLKCNLENLAIALSEWNGLKNESSNIPNIAAETGNMQFLQYLYEKTDNDNNSNNNNNNTSQHQGLDLISKQRISNTKSKPTIYRNIFKTEDTFQPNFNINSIIKIISTNVDNPMKNAHLNKMLTWENIDKDRYFIEALFQYKCFDQISLLLSKYPPEKFSKSNYFRQVIESYQTELILFFLKKRECRSILLEHNLQEYIVREYMPYGDRIYYGAEMLVYIYKNQWNGNLTKELCKNIMKAIKTKDILNCHSPILTSLLLIEFLSQVKEISISNVSRCEKVINELNEYCKNIQESNPQESYISYLMKQKDTRERSAFQIISENSIYSLLETPEIGTIVKKMWDGTLSNNGFLAASSLHRFLFDSSKPNNPFMSFDSMDINKVYYFQLQVWLDSCALRFNPVGLATITLAVIFNVFIYLLTLEGKLMNDYNELNSTLQWLLKIYLLWASILILDIVNQIIFCIKAKRPFHFEALQYLDLALFVFAWLVVLDPKKIFKEYQVMELSKTIHNALWALELPFAKELATELSYYTSHTAFLFKAAILSINDLLVWVRVTGVLLTYKQMGPVMRMIFAMAMLLLRYIVIIALFLACCAGVFTALFNRFSPQFVDFSTSIISLFGGFLNNFDLTGFEEAYVGFGSVMFIAYVCIAGVLLVNLLIAVLSNVYENLAKVVDASHRAVLIQYYRRYKWDKDYGYLLFLTPPLNILNIPIYLLNCVSCCNQTTFNTVITRIMLFIFYFPFIILTFSLYTLIILPFCYIKGMIRIISHQSSIRMLTIFKVFNFFKWFLGGFFYLLFIQIKDVVYCFIHIFRTVKAKGDEFERVRRNMSNQDVIIFLKFIHSKNSLLNKKDIHSLFMAYLEFEAAEKAQINETARKAKEYINKIDKASRQMKNQMVETNKVMLYNNIEGGNNASAIYTAYIKKNLMIIEILENFVIDDELGGTYVDIEKMKKLLPLTMNIKNYHLRRLINSDIHALTQAMTKLKSSKVSFLQYQLMNKIMASAQRLDKNIDVEVLRVQRFSNTSSTEVKGNNNNSRVEESEQLKKVKQQREEIEQMKKYDSLIKTIHSNVSEIINAKGMQSYRSSADESYVSSNNIKTSLNPVVEITIPNVK